MTTQATDFRVFAFRPEPQGNDATEPATEVGYLTLDDPALRVTAASASQDGTAVAVRAVSGGEQGQPNLDVVALWHREPFEPIGRGPGRPAHPRLHLVLRYREEVELRGDARVRSGTAVPSGRVSCGPTISRTRVHRCSRQNGHEGDESGRTEPDRTTHGPEETERILGAVLSLRARPCGRGPSLMPPRRAQARRGGPPSPRSRRGRRCP